MAARVCFTNTLSLVPVGKPSRGWTGEDYVLEKREEKSDLLKQGALDSVALDNIGRIFILKRWNCVQLDNIQIHSFPSSSHHRVTDLICDKNGKKLKENQNQVT